MDITFRFGTFNLHGDDLRQDSANFKILLAKWGSTFLAKADLLAVQELWTPGGPWDNTYLDILANESGLTYRGAAYGPDLDPTWPRVGLLSRYPFVSGPNSNLYGPSNLDDKRHSKFQDATIEYNGHRITFCTTWMLGGDDVTNVYATYSMLQYLQTKGADSANLIFGGDFNCGLVGGPYSVILADPALNFKDAALVSETVPETCVALNDRVDDFIFFNGPYRVLSVECFPSESDHPFVLATFTSRPPTPPNDAEFWLQSVPATVVQGTVYPVSISMKNTGSASWNSAANYRLGSQAPQDNLLWGTNRVQLDHEVASGEIAAFDFSIQSSSIGSAAFQWQMVQDGVEWFGAATELVNIVTVSAEEPAECESLRGQILSLDTQIQELTDQLSGDPHTDAALRGRILKLQKQLSETKAHATALGCTI